MEKYFDAFLYLANWSSRQFMLRLPRKLMEQQVVAPYCAGENFSYRLKDDSIIHSFRSEQEDSEWKDGEGWLTTLVQMRSELMHGDYRAAEKARREREQAEKRKKHLGSLAGRESSLWAKVDELIATKLPKRYDEAVSLLQESA